MKKQVFALFAVTALSGCVQPAQSAHTAPVAQPGQMAMQQPMGMVPAQGMPMAAPVNSYQNNNAATMALFSKTLSELDAMRDRLRRTEKAMVRLDRRMQLLERNELTRMSDESPAAMPAPASSFAPPAQQQPRQNFRPMSFNNTPAPQQVSSAPRNLTPQPNFQQVAFNNTSVSAPARAVLQPAAPRQPQVDRVSANTAINTGLPSLADKTPQNTVADTSVSIWTVNYQNGKVWPSRDQLLAARDVVESLTAGQPVALFARGANPSSREFRDRVKALSRYLGQVANLDSVPIASMSAGHLDTDTIEILATK